jgi:hypothetical protein
MDLQVKLPPTLDMWLSGKRYTKKQSKLALNADEQTNSGQ